MKIQCSKIDLLNSVNIVLKAVPGKSTMPILEYIVIDATGDNIKLITNNMELGIETILKGEIIEKGSVALNARVFSEIVRKLPESTVNLAADDNLLTEILCEKAKFKISGLPSDDFPYLPYIETNNPITLSQFTLKELIRQTVFSISDNESNKIMTGELFDINGNELKVVALDGHRISIRKIEMKKEYDDNKIIVPGKTLIEISKILSGEASDMVNIFTTDKHILFEFDQTIVLSRLIEGQFYKIDQMLSTDYETKISINKKELQDCILAYKGFG